MPRWDKNYEFSQLFWPCPRNKDCHRRVAPPNASWTPHSRPPGQERWGERGQHDVCQLWPIHCPWCLPRPILPGRWWTLYRLLFRIWRRRETSQSQMLCCPTPTKWPILQGTSSKLLKHGESCGRTELSLRGRICIKGKSRIANIIHSIFAITINNYAFSSTTPLPSSTAPSSTAPLKTSATTSALVLVDYWKHPKSEIKFTSQSTKIPNVSTPRWDSVSSLAISEPIFTPDSAWSKP